VTVRLPNTTVQDNPSGRATWSRAVVDALRGLVTQLSGYLPLTGGTLTGDLIVPADPYDATSWNGNNEVPTKNDIRDKIETLGGSGATITGTPASGNLTKFSGASTITNGDLSGDVTTSGTLAATIANGAVTLAKQANVATSTVFYRKTAGSGAPEVQTLATLKTDLGLTGTNSGDQTITLTGDVTGTGTGSFAATIANNAVTYAKMQDASATSRILARKTAGSGDYEECTVAEVLNFIASSAQGDVMIRDGSGWTRLAAGTSGQFLKTQGAGANAAWAYPNVIRLDSLAAAVSSTATTSEEFLYTYSVPAGTLAANGNALEVTISGQLAATTRSRNVKIYFGATSQTVFTTTVNTHVVFQGTFLLTRTGATTQICSSVKSVSANNGSPTSFVARMAPAETLSGAVDLKFSSTVGVGATAGDVILEQVVVKLIT
jgi:hypothetical protein